MTDYLRIVGPFHAPTGYSHMTRGALRAALLAGYTVQAIESDYRLQFTRHTSGQVTRCEQPPKVRVPLPDCQWDEVDAALATEIPPSCPTLLIQLPPNLNQRCHFVDGPKIGWTMVESDTVCPEWSWGMRGCDTVLAPSEACARAFRGAGLADVRVMPIPVDERVWHIEGHAIPMPAGRPPFLFVSVFSTSERKQWRLLMQAFTEEFREERDDVGLIVHPTRPFEVDEMAGWCVAAGAWIYVDKETRTDHDMAALYRACDCYVCPSPEGFGLPFVEAALCGIPSIALDGGGAADVVSDETGYLLPTTQQPLIGHMPHVYPSSHRFPLTTLTELRATLRWAYEQRADALRVKGARAREVALLRWTPAALAPRLREEIDRANDSRKARLWSIAGHTGSACLSADTMPETRPQYALAIGAWGDAFVSAGIAQERRDAARPLHFLHYGYDADITKWLAAQPFVASARNFQPPSARSEMLRQFSQMCQSRWAYAEKWLPWFAGLMGVPSEDVLFTQINQSEDQPLCLWHDAALPQELREWADVQRQEYGPFVLLHPISIQSAPSKEHWPFWVEALRWLLQSSPHTYVLTGQVRLDLPRTDRLIDLVGRTSSMMEVLALTEVAEGAISTCNAVSLWCAMQRVPGLIVSNSVFNCHADYYHRFIQAPTNTILYQYDTLEWFEVVAKAWLAERFGLPVPEIPWAVEEKEAVTA